MLTALIAVSVLSQAPSVPLVDDDGIVEGAPTAPVTATKFVSKMTFGIGSFQGANGFSTGEGKGMLGRLGGYLRVGWQLTEHWGFGFEGAASTIAITSVLRGAAFVTFTANDWFTFGLGGAVATNYESLPNLFGGGSNSSNSYQSSYGAAVARIDFHVISSRNESGGRRAFDVGLEIEAGKSLDQNDGGESVYVTMGFVYW